MTLYVKKLSYISKKIIRLPALRPFTTAMTMHAYDASGITYKYDAPSKIGSNSTSQDLQDNGNNAEPSSQDAADNVRTRHYQAEMLQYSLKQNIICTMDTGSGKTHIAILRIREELEKSHQKISWFLAPTVTLSKQQGELLKQSLPCQVILLDGETIQKWNKRVWGEILDRVKNGVIVSTHQVLKDALAHGFVRFGDGGNKNAKKIGLLIFDEGAYPEKNLSHHCSGNHPAKKIMDDHYKPLMEGRDEDLPIEIAMLDQSDRIRALDLPAILGLTASPLIRARPQDLHKIESNMFAVARTPKIHKEELLKHVHPPILKRVLFKPYIGHRYVEIPTPPPQTLVPTPPTSPSRTVKFAKPLSPTKFVETISLDDLRAFSFTGVLSSRNGVPNNDPDVMEIDNPWAEPTPEKVVESPALVSLEAAKDGMNIQEDPYVVYLRRNNDTGALSKTVANQKTWCRDEMKVFVQRAQYINNEFGVWCAEYFIAYCITKFLKMYFPDRITNSSSTNLEDYDVFGDYGGYGGSSSLGDDAIAGDERLYLANIFQNVKIQDIEDPLFFEKINDSDMLTPKVLTLIESVLEELKHEEQPEDFSGLVFVEQRAGVAMLSHIISVHPLTRDTFRPGVLIGSSIGKKDGRLRIGELMSPVHEFNILKEFREGLCNLLISTSVAEEGIDIQACAVVFCFTLPPNLKSFIQRRGRARRKGSRCVLMYPTRGSNIAKLADWQRLEGEMKKVYEDDMRVLLEETTENEEYEDADMRFTVPSTKALLTLDSAIPKLSHFCGVLPKASYLDTRPVFEVEKESDPAFPSCQCVVTLPTCIPPEVRRAQTNRVWMTEKRAKQEAAFNACIALYKAGLLDDHLLPLMREDEDEEKRMALAGIESRPSKVLVGPVIEPWVIPWDEENGAWETIVHIQHWTWYLYTPFKIPDCIASFPLYISPAETFYVQIGQSEWRAKATIVERYGSWENARRFCREFFWSIYSTRMDPDTEKLDFPYIFVPRDPDLEEQIRHGERFSTYDMWVLDLEFVESQGSIGIIRDTLSNLKPYILTNIYDGEEAEQLKAEMLADTVKYTNKIIEEGQRVLEVVPLPLRRDFLHIDANWQEDEVVVSKRMRKTYLFPQFCRVDDLRYSVTRQAMIVPSIIREIGLALIADNIRTGFLASCNLENQTLELVKQAITHTAAREQNNYERLEFIGDCTLKYLTAVQVAGEYPLWHEGLLTSKKDRTVANSRLARAAIEKGIAKWIVDEAFTGSKWKPHYLTDTIQAALANENTKNRNLSTKVLADVIEALIGVCYLTGGFERALDCINIFDLDVKIAPMPDRHTALYDSYPDLVGEVPSLISDLEALIGYKFSKKTIIMEAMTHPSVENEHSGMSYQRLEFIGDAVLDMIVVDEIFKNGHEIGGKEYSHIEMHLYKSAAVNADMLAHLCLSLSETLETADVKRIHGDEVPKVERKIPFSAFMKSHSQALTTAKIRSKQRHDRLAEEIEAALDPDLVFDDDGNQIRQSYPWVKLAALEADKFLSDIVESTIGAVYVDSHGNLDIVKQVVENFGVLRVLRQILRKDVDPSHPVKKLGELAGKDLKTVRYEIDQEIQTNRFGATEFNCTVWVGEVAVAKVDRGSSRVEVRTRAAEVAWLNLLASNIAKDW
ncbi:hypothetical protein ABW19_dt0200687 [Dactylella cylindrospora]|nr:hypothetical protein ABW19_dt0200687 [Dactylella cylindrospora]